MPLNAKRRVAAKSRETIGKKRKWPWVLGSLSVVLAVSVYFSNYLLEISRYTIRLPRLPRAFDGLRVVLLTDWHGARFGTDNEVLLKMVRDEAPDIIAMTGDFVETEMELEGFETLCRQLAAIAPSYYVTGNHEWGGRVARRARERAALCGVVNLDNEWVTLSRSGQSILLVGIEDLGGPFDQLTLGEVTALARGEDDPFVLMLCHRYDRWDEFVAQEVDLVLSGHAHGGVVRLPFTDGLYGPGQVFFPKRTSGVNREGGTAMVTGRGLGSPGGIPLRLFNPPEVVSLILRTGAP